MKIVAYRGCSSTFHLATVVPFDLHMTRKENDPYFREFKHLIWIPRKGLELRADGRVYRLRFPHFRIGSQYPGHDFSDDYSLYKNKRTGEVISLPYPYSSLELYSDWGKRTLDTTRFVVGETYYGSCASISFTITKKKEDPDGWRIDTKEGDDLLVRRVPHGEEVTFRHETIRAYQLAPTDLFTKREVYFTPMERTILRKD